ncbi:MAG TPA: AmmeMemoRadiSam system protein A [Vicinamibacterales bacterium]|nr:AmmeMemoRadiSam system protein A [Vicinamibacterales bacterium]
MIADADRQRLLALAREALVARVRGTRPPRPPEDLIIPACGVFVTVYDRSDLRGCLGTVNAREPLAEAVVRLAGDVACEDRRFEPIAAHEIDGIVIDLSVLTAPELVEDPATIIVGRDGLIIEHGSRKGLLLPQVAPEHGWDRVEFLAHTCVKAGLEPDAWRNGATIFRFEAEVFGEGG